MNGDGEDDDKKPYGGCLSSDNELLGAGPVMTSNLSENYAKNQKNRMNKI